MAAGNLDCRKKDAEELIECAQPEQWPPALRIAKDEGIDTGGNEQFATGNRRDGGSFTGMSSNGWSSGWATRQSTPTNASMQKPMTSATRTTMRNTWGELLLIRTRLEWRSR